MPRPVDLMLKNILPMDAGAFYPIPDKPLPYSVSHATPLYMHIFICTASNPNPFNYCTKELHN